MTRFGVLYPDGSITVVMNQNRTEEEQLQECRDVARGGERVKVVEVEVGDPKEVA